MFSLKRILSLVLVLCFGLLVFTSCDTGDGSGLTHLGTWTSMFDESYAITASTLSYTGFDGSTYAGYIRYIEYFTDTAGVIIYEYTTRQEYWDYNPNPPYNKIDGTMTYGPGNFHATYFKDLTGNSVQLAGVIDLTTNKGCEAATLALAKAKFTLDNVDTFVSFWPSYAKQ